MHCAHRQQCKFDARANGSAEVTCVSSQNPTAVYRKGDQWANATRLTPGDCHTSEADASCQTGCRPALVYTVRNDAVFHPHAGQSCIVQPGDRVALVESPDMPLYELRTDSDDAASAAWGSAAAPQMYAQPQPAAATPPSASAVASGAPAAIPLPLPMVQQAEDAQGSQPPLKR